MLKDTLLVIFLLRRLLLLLLLFLLRSPLLRVLLLRQELADAHAASLQLLAVHCQSLLHAFLRFKTNDSLTLGLVRLLILLDKDVGDLSAASELLPQALLIHAPRKIYAKPTTTVPTRNGNLVGVVVFLALSREEAGGVILLLKLIHADRTTLHFLILMQTHESYTAILFNSLLHRLLRGEGDEAKSSRTLAVHNHLHIMSPKKARQPPPQRHRSP